MQNYCPILITLLSFSCVRGNTKTAKMAANTMDAIKKKMQAMKLEKEAALDKADQLEQKLNEQKEKNDKVSPSP